MSESAWSSSSEENQNSKKIGFSSLLLSNFQFFCSFIISHPFYSSYILFFSPYMFKILSFLSPLFVTTTLLLLALLSTLHLHDTFPDSESLESQPGFLVSFCSKLGGVLEPQFDVNNGDVNELEAYKMVVEACSMEYASKDESMEVTFVDKFCSHEVSITLSKALTDDKPVEIQPLKLEDPMELEKEEETEKCEMKEGEEQKVKLESDVVLDNGEGHFWKEPTKGESKAQKVDLVGDCDDESYDLPRLSDFLGEEKKNKVSDQKEEEDVSLKSFGSMRKEKEWRRTLACKLFEERHNADVGQGMDQLWETYETETEKKQTEEDKKKEKKKTKKSITMMKTKSMEKKEVVVEEEDDDDGIDQQQLCCLQALKFSTGKMHLGIARPNLVKLSKAFKGFGKFYNANKHPKKA
ncbi:Acidic leucine-rich nuclear phosphoprotein 32 family B protein [Hirschfeldia incana]|nr:Acidic leucine-rich nuclear phosphoprotein 32 family B protein [Hirschfeldia incana]